MVLLCFKAVPAIQLIFFNDIAALFVYDFFVSRIHHLSVELADLFVQTFASLQNLFEIDRLSEVFNSAVEVCLLDGTVQFTPLYFKLAKPPSAIAAT